MRAIIVAAIYVAPFLAVGIGVKIWMARKGVGLFDVRVQGDPNRRRSRFLLGIWRYEDRDKG